MSTEETSLQTVKGAVVRKKARLQAQKAQVQKLQEQLTAAQKIAKATEMQIEKHNEQVRDEIKSPGKFAIRSSFKIARTPSLPPLS